VHSVRPPETPGQKEKSGDLWQKWGVVFTLIGLILAYIGTASQVHWVPFNRGSQITPQPAITSSSQAVPSQPVLAFPSIEHTTPRLSLSPSAGPGGSTITVTGASFAPSSLVTFDFQAVQVAQKESNSKGAVEVSFAMPSEFDVFRVGTTFSVSASDSMDNSPQQTFTLVE
jgi:hypothetical protein